MEHRTTATVSISPELFRQAFGFPESTIITGMEADVGRVGSITLRLEHPDLPKILEGCEIPRIYPQFRFDPVTNRLEFLGWNPKGT